MASPQGKRDEPEMRSRSEERKKVKRERGEQDDRRKAGPCTKEWDRDANPVHQYHSPLHQSALTPSPHRHPTVVLQ